MTPQSFRGYVSLTKLSFRIIFPFFSITCTLHHKRDYDEQKEVVVVYASIPVFPIKRETCSTRRYLRGLGIHVRLIIKSI